MGSEGGGMSAYGPHYSGDAMDAAEDAAATCVGMREAAHAAMQAAHDPVLGLDASVNLGWVLDVLSDWHHRSDELTETPGQFVRRRFTER